TAFLSRAACALALVLPDAPVRTRQQTTTATASQMLRVFLDCNRCDDNYVKKEVTFIDYVRNREDADVHVLVTTQETGGGGNEWTLKFIGLGPKNQGADQTLTYNSTATATGAEIRAGFVEVSKLGLVRYAVNTPIADRL